MVKLLLIISFIFTGPLYSQWNAGNGVPISTLPGDQLIRNIISDKNGGNWVIYTDIVFTPDNDPKLFVQHIDKNGYTTLTEHGIALNMLDHKEIYLGGSAAPDGSLLIFYQAAFETLDGPTLIYFQKISTSGQKAWGERGRDVWPPALDDLSNYIDLPFGDLIEGENGACYLTFAATSTETDDRYTYIQKMNTNGDRLWGDSAIRINDGFWSGPAFKMFLFPASNGAIVAYQPSLGEKLIIQHFTSTGELTYAEPGIIVNPPPFQGDYDYNFILAESTDGINLYTAVTKSDSNNNPFTEIVIQQYDSQGIPKNGEYGISVSDSDRKIKHVDDLWVNSDGSIVYLFYKSLYGDEGPLYLGKASADGNRLWSDERIVTSDTARLSATLVAIKEGYQVVCGKNDSSAVYVQYIDTAGNLLWSNHGVGIANVDRLSAWPSLQSDSNGDCVVCWHDSRNADTKWDIYCAKIDKSGILPIFPGHVNVEQSETVRIYPNPSDEQIMLSYPESWVIKSLKVTDILGRIVWKSTEQMQSIDIRWLPAGVYNLALTHQYGQKTLSFCIR